MSTKVVWPPEAKPNGATRRPLMRISVACAPRPRSDALPAPGVKLATAFSLNVPVLFDGSFFSTSVTDRAPERSMSWRVITCTGAGVSVSMRLMREPVTSTRSSCWLGVRGILLLRPNDQ